jgi:hypothetical protein
MITGENQAEQAAALDPGQGAVQADRISENPSGPGK